MRTTFHKVALVMVFCAAWVCQGLIAQTTGTGSITGTVMDSSGGGVPRVSITVVQVATGLSRSTTTDASGYYVFSALPIGVYEVTATVPGFNKFDQKGVFLNADSTLGINIPLQVGATTNTVTVRATQALLNTTSGAVNTLVPAFFRV